MSEDVYARLSRSQAFKDYIRRQHRVAWLFSGMMVAVYFLFILLLAFKPELLGRPLYDGSVITLGIPAGISIILFAFLITGLYVRKANREFDPIRKKLVEEAMRDP